MIYSIFFLQNNTYILKNRKSIKPGLEQYYFILQRKSQIQ